MSPEGDLPLSFLRPGGTLLVAMGGLILLALLARVLLRRVLGGERYDRWTAWIEGILFCLILVVMLSLSGLQIVLRNLFRSGLLWIDPLVRALVLWLAFLGALTATSHARHLHIDVLHRLLSARIGGQVSRVLSVLSSICCAFLANGAYAFLRDEYQYGTSPFLGIPSWLTQSILFLGFGLLTYRFLVQAIWPAPRRGEP